MPSRDAGAHARVRFQAVHQRLARRACAGETVIVFAQAAAQGVCRTFLIWQVLHPAIHLPNLAAAQGVRVGGARVAPTQRATTESDVESDNSESGDGDIINEKHIFQKLVF